MAGYLARRLLLSLLTLLVVTLAVYVAIRLAPGEPGRGDEKESRAAMEAWLDRCHARDPIPVGYARWLGDLGRLDLGVSLGVQPGRPVAALVADALPFTVVLGSLAFLLTLTLALPLGVLAAWRPGSGGARAGTALVYLVHALPAFWIALALQQVVAGRLGLLPVLGPGPPGIAGEAMTAGRVLASVPYWILPAVSIALGSLAFVIRFCRDNLLEAMAEPYVLAARARGAGDGRVLLRHAMMNTVVPLISLAGLMLPGILSGSVLIESIFSLPGVGRLFLVAAGRRDYPVVMAVALMTAVGTIVAHLVTDLMYRMADPRIDAGGAAGEES